MGYTDLPIMTDVHEEFREQLGRLTRLFSDNINALTLHSFQEIWKKNPAAMINLVEKIKKMADQAQHALTAEHINCVIESLALQKQLPATLIQSIEHYLSIATIETMTQKLDKCFTQDSKWECYEPNLLKQTMHISNHLNLLPKNSSVNLFLRLVLSAVIKFNEQEQYKENPLQRAQTITTRLVLSLDLDENADLKQFIDFITNRIMLATTYIESPIRSISLAETFFIIQEVLQATHLPISHEANRELITSINTLMLTLSVCKKKPSVFYDLVTLEQNKKESATLPIIKRLFSTPLYLEQFFACPDFQPYFGDKKSQNALNQHAFLMSLRIYLSAQTNRYDIAKKFCPPLLQFINLAKRQRIKYSDNQEFMSWFNQAYILRNLHANLFALLFSNLERNVKLHLSQVGGLIFTAKKFLSMGFSPRSAAVATTGQFQPLINHNVALTDAKNLQALHHFFSTLAPHEQSNMMQEILLAMVFQSETVKFDHSPLMTQKTKRSTATIVNPSKHAASRHRRQRGRFFAKAHAKEQPHYPTSKPILNDAKKNKSPILH